MSQQRNATVAGRGARPLAPRSLILSLLLGMRTPRRSGSQLVAWCGAFGVAEGTARVALSRMVGVGELTTNAGVYELAGRLRQRGRDQEFALAPRYSNYDGEWSMFVVIAERRVAVARAELRTALRHGRYSERRPGVWLRPANLAASTAAVVQEQCEEYSVRPSAPRVLAAELFSPTHWATVSLALLSEVRGAVDHLGDSEGLSSAFEVGARTVAHLRSDPLLPTDLLPRGWPGDRLRSEYRSFQPVFSAAVKQWFASM